MNERVRYESDRRPDAAELLAFYQRQKHPSAPSRAHLQRLIDDSFCFVSARRDGELIGVARGTTDGVIGRLAECKLDPSYQGPACVTRTDGRIEHDDSGIAKEMARRVIEALDGCGVERIDVTAHGTEVDFCEELGFRRVPGMVAMGLTCRPPRREAAEVEAVAAQ